MYCHFYAFLLVAIIDAPCKRGGRVGGEEAKGNRLKIGLLSLSLFFPPRGGQMDLLKSRLGGLLFTYADGGHGGGGEKEGEALG